LEGQGDGFDQRAVLGRLPLAKDAGPGQHTVSEELEVSVGRDGERERIRGEENLPS
jgi:hypothetical protein